MKRGYVLTEREYQNLIKHIEEAEALAQTIQKNKDNEDYIFIKSYKLVSILSRIKKEMESRGNYSEK